MTVELAHLPAYCERTLADRFLRERGWTLAPAPGGGRIARLVHDGAVLVEEPIDPPCPCSTPTPAPARGGTR